MKPSLPCQKYSPVCRGEKKVLNDYNHTPSEKGGPKHPLPAANSAKRKERVSSPKEKIFLLVNNHAHTRKLTLMP